VIPRTLKLLPEYLYPADEWALVETGFSEDWLGHAETLFSLSNGFIGIRGTLDEGRPSVEAGTFLNGFHETWPIVHAEQAYGFARTGQTIVSAPDVSLIKVYVDDEPLHLPTARTTAYERRLDLREGRLVRDLTWSTPGGKHVRVRSSRIVSLEHRHLGAIMLELELLDHDAPVTLSSQVLNRQDARADDEPRPVAEAGGRDPRRARGFTGRVLNAAEHVEDALRIITGYRTTNSRMTMSVGVDHVVETDNEWSFVRSWSEDLGKVVLNVDARAGVPIRLIKFFTFHTSRTVPTLELVDRAARTLDRGCELGHDGLVASQRHALAHFWERSDVEVGAGERIQQAVRWNLFQLGQASARAETTGIPAKGLTGHAYEGHYFWDTEIYLTPFLTYTEPRITRNLLRFRHSMLDRARERAAELSESGALFPWRTINGEEASSYYAAGTAQYHIDADIAHAIKRYTQIRGDLSLLEDIGAEMLVETARMWAGLGFHSPGDGRFHIHGVTGPDEYTTVVNDNAFTNLMARGNLRFAADTVEWLRSERPEGYRRLVGVTGLAEDEVARWRAAADAMYVPYDEARRIHMQDAHFLDREVWDFEGTPRDHYPLLLHYHPLVIYRHQVIKQADVVLAMFLLGDEFSLEQKRRNFDYYDPLTTGDSSLSACVQAIVAAEIGYEERALEYFQYALLMDLADVSGNVVDGVHIASTGGVWMALVHGFGGLRDHGGALTFDPRLPRDWERLAFRLRVRDRWLAVEVLHGTLRLELLEGEPLEVQVQGRDLTVRVGAPVVQDVVAHPALTPADGDAPVVITRPQ
jgi:alpha,alpha-trehalose phosphorylase